MYLISFKDNLINSRITEHGLDTKEKSYLDFGEQKDSIKCGFVLKSGGGWLSLLWHNHTGTLILLLDTAWRIEVSEDHKEMWAKKCTESS